MESPHEVVQAAYSNTSNSIHQQQWKAVHNIHWRGEGGGGGGGGVE